MALRALRRHAKEADAVIAHGSSTLAACAIGLAGTGVPFIYRQISDPLFWAATWRRRVRVAIFIHRARRVIALSADTATLMAKRYRLDEPRLVVSPNAVPDDAFFPATERQRADSREALGLAEGDFVIAYVGALVAEKGVDVAVRSLRNVPSSAVLIVVGDGPEAPKLAALANEVAGRVRFLGTSTEPLMIYHAADLVVLPSRGGDSMPACLIESGLCALPAVATDVGAIPEVVLDHESGFVVPPDDQGAFDEAVQLIVNDRGLRHAFGEAARNHCKRHYTIQAVAPTWLDVIQRVVDR